MNQPSRPVEERNLASDQVRLAEFSQAMLGKWQEGRRQHGSTMMLDPFEEAQKECLDLANYALEIYFRLKVLKVRVSEIQQEVVHGQ